MKLKLVLSGLAALLCCSFANADNLTIERIYDSPKLSGKAPLGLKFSPDGSRITYLQGKKEDFRRYDLWEYNIKDKQHRLLVDSAKLFEGEEVLSDEEKARRERMRIKGSGIVSYIWSEDGKALLFPANGDLYYYDLKRQSSRQLTDTAEFETDGQFSPKGNYVSFIRQQNLFVLDLKSGQTKQLTNDGGGTIKNGMAEFVAQEEMDRMTGYWWAPDESKIAFTRTDESKVAEVVRNEIYAEEIKLYNQRYPFAGSTNATVALAVVDLSTGKKDWLDLGKDPDFYLARGMWAEDSRHFSYQWQARNQQKLELRFYDNMTKKTKVMVTESSNTWLNLNDGLYFLKDLKHFLWISERDGYAHLYLYQMNGHLVRQLTKGEWVVDELEGVDEDKGLVYFSGSADSPLESQLYRIGLFEHKERQRLTEANSFHRVSVAKDFNAFVDYHTPVDAPGSVILRNAEGAKITYLLDNTVNSDHPLYPYINDLVKPNFGTVKAADGQDLYYQMFQPKSLIPGKKYPVIVSVYGGPEGQKIFNKFNGNYFLQYMVQQGFIVFQLDNRGTGGRGKVFDDPIYRQLGEVELADQIAGVKFLRTLAQVDSKRIGIYGHSYGGYMALMAMFKAPEYFQAGVAGAPVTDWRLYDTFYTERYLSHPNDNAQGYDASSVFPYAKNLTGSLLIYHGMADDNVLFSNSTKLFKTLQDQGLPFEMMTYPGAKHGMRGKETSIHLHKTVASFFTRHLKP